MIAPSLAGKSLAIPDRNYRTEILALEGWTLARCPVQVNFSALIIALIRIELPSLLFARHCSTCAINSSLHFDSMRQRTYCSSSEVPSGENSETDPGKSRHRGRQYMRDPRAA
jgi:hypothetical protein